MKKSILVYLATLVFLSACNLPAGKSTPSADVITTRVAGTLAAVVPPTATITEPTQAFPTIAQESATPSPTATVTVTPTPTTSSDDPKLTLGNPDFWFSPASSGDPFGVANNPYNDAAVTISNQASGLNFSSKTIDGGKRWRLTSTAPTDFYLEGTFKVSICSGHDNYGLAMRIPNYDSTLGYFVGLSCDGSYIVDRLDAAGNGVNIIGWTPNTNIKIGENQTNRLGVMLVDDTFKLYINGSFVAEFTDSVIDAKGHVGAYVSARGKSNFTVDLQELLVWIQ